MIFFTRIAENYDRQTYQSCIYELKKMGKGKTNRKDTRKREKENRFKAQIPPQEALLDNEPKQINLIVFESITPDLIKNVARVSRGSTGPSGLDADAWTRMLTCFLKGIGPLIHHALMCRACFVHARLSCREHGQPRWCKSQSSGQAARCSANRSWRSVSLHNLQSDRESGEDGCSEGYRTDSSVRRGAIRMRSSCSQHGQAISGW